jgi:hypothetical protein
VIVGGEVMAHSLLKKHFLLILKTRGNKKAQSLIEYGLIIILIAVVIITVLGLLGVQVNTLYENVINSFPES